ncbi:MAG: SLC13 family permease [Caldimonas sp.]
MTEAAGQGTLAALAAGGLSGHGVAMLVFTAIAFAAFAWDRVPLASVCMAILVGLPLAFTAFPLAIAGQAVDPGRFFAGFGHPALVAICALMILGHALVVTGALEPLARRLAALVATRPRLALAAVLVGVMLASGFVNDTPLVVLMIPLLLSATERAKVPAAGVLMPMNFAVLIGGMSTTIGTSTNLIVISIAASLGVAPFGMLDFYGLVAVAAVPALLYLWLLAPVWLRSVPAPAGVASTDAFDAELHLDAGTPMIGKELREAVAATGGRMRVVDLHDRRGRPRSKLPTMRLREGDRLGLQDTVANLKEFETLLGASLHGIGDEPASAGAGATAAATADEESGSPRHADAIVAQLVVTPLSPLLGRSARDHRIAEQHGLVVVGVRQSGARMPLPSAESALAGARRSLAALRSSRPNRGVAGDRGEVAAFASAAVDSATHRTVAERDLSVGDVLLVQGNIASIRQAQQSGLGALLDAQLVLPRRHKAPLALATMAVVVLLIVTKLLPVAVAALAGVLFLLASKAVAFSEITASLSIKVVLLVAASFALGDALTLTGATHWLAGQLVGVSGGLAPRWVLVLLMLLMGILTNFVSNNAAAAIGTPIAVELARQLGVPPEPYVLAVLFGCNLCYATPMGYQTNLLVMNAAGYRFGDFVRVGTPLFFIVGGVLSAMLVGRYGL